MSDDEFMELVKLAQTQSDVEAMNAIFQYFDQDIKRLGKLFRMPKEDAIGGILSWLMFVNILKELVLVPLNLT
ncbi:hypothetical protein C1I60_04730 [Paenibacillus terrae]|uniref:Helix-turn-helix conjugative transposon-like domain-containing protein n=1 Tax=Paenibacillus terrae TaxID=159743 RepID=A0A4U2Q167_9BACL|nr:hypothetical protein C1I60_04730 [Paenibacillus terrae]